jgi:hypothetical protein
MGFFVLPKLIKMKARFHKNFSLSGFQANKTYIIKQSGKIEFNKFVPLSLLTKLFDDIEQILYSNDTITIEGENDELFVGSYVNIETTYLKKA